MNWFAKFEKKFSKYAIKIIVLYAIGFVMNTFFNGLYDAYFSLDFAMIFKGQVWRLITFILQPPSNSIIFVVFVLYFYYLIGSVLERIWGSFRFNVYFFTGVILNILASLIIYLIWGLSFKLSTNYINLALFMAFAMEQPDMEVLLFFIIPIKMKWLAVLDVVLLAVDAVQGGLIIRIVIIASLLNFIIFFFCNRNLRGHSPKQAARRKKFQKQISRPQNQYAGGAKHRCAVCGRTELDNPTLEFRYCSKCNGNYEYCQDHLFTHEHVK